jgi:ATP-dependent Clp protease ATP-binding subunit ClpC
MFEKFTQKARRSLYYARQQAANLGAESIAPEHLLLGMLDVDPEQINKLSTLGSDCAASLRSGLITGSKHTNPTRDALPLSSDTKQMLRCAHENDFRLRQSNIDVRHLLLGVLSYDEEVQKSTGQSLPVARILVEHGFDKEIVQERILATGDI